MEEWNLVAISPGMETHSLELGHGTLYRETVAGEETIAAVALEYVAHPAVPDAFTRIMPNETPGPTPGIPEQLLKLYEMQTALAGQCPSLACTDEQSPANNPFMELQGGVWACQRCGVVIKINHGREAMTAEENYLWNQLLLTKSEEWFIGSKGQTP